MRSLHIPAVVVSGLGKGSYFISLDWVRARLAELMSADAVPGTLNLRIAQNLREELFSRRKEFARVSAPGSAACSGYLLAATLMVTGERRLQVWAILPELTVHPNTLEIVSQFSLREMMSLSDGDCVTIEVGF